MTAASSGTGLLLIISVSPAIRPLRCAFQDGVSFEKVYRLEKELDKKAWSVDVVPVNGPDDLREVTRGSDVQIVQLKPGRLQGSITHFEIGNVGISLGRFSSEI